MDRETLNDPIVLMYLPFFQRNEINNLIVLKSLHEIINIGLEHNANFQNSQISVQFIADFLIRLDLVHSFNCSLEWQLFTELITKHKSLVDESLLTKLAANLSRIGLNNFEAYLEFINVCLTSNSANVSSKLSVAIFVPSLFEYLISFCSLDTNSESSFSLNYKLKVTNLLELVTKLISSSSLSDLDQVDLIKSDLFNFIEYEDVDTLNQDPNEAINRQKLNLLCAHFILNESDLELTKKIAELFQRLNKRWPFLCVTFFTIYMNKIKTCSDHQITVYLLDTLIDLIVPKVMLHI